MEQPLKELQVINDKTEQLKEAMTELSALLPDSDKYPKGFEKDVDRADKIERWLDKYEKSSKQILAEIMLSAATCAKYVIFIKALQYVAKFRTYKQNIIEDNKILPKDQKKSVVKFTVTCLLNAWGVSIPWRKLETAWAAKGKRIGVKGNYLPLDKETLSLKAQDFAGAGEHKEVLADFFEEQFSQCRVESSTLEAISRYAKRLAGSGS